MEIIFRHLSLSEIGAEQLLKMSKNTTSHSNTIQRSLPSHTMIFFKLTPTKDGHKYIVGRLYSAVMPDGSD